MTGNRSASDGGGIYNYGTLTLNDTRVSANIAGGGGGGLFSEGVATLNRSVVTGNTAAYGGGILSVNTLTLNQTTVSGNPTPDAVETYADAGASSSNTNLFRWNPDATLAGRLPASSGISTARTNGVELWRNPVLQWQP